MKIRPGKPSYDWNDNPISEHPVLFLAVEKTVIAAQNLTYCLNILVNISGALVPWNRQTILEFHSLKDRVQNIDDKKFLPRVN